MDRSADVDEQTEVQRQIGFAAEIQNGLRRLVIVENGEITLIEVADELAMLVGGDEQHVHFIDPLANSEAGLRIVFRGRSGIVGAETHATTRSIRLSENRRSAGKSAGQGENRHKRQQAAGGVRVLHS